mmetsp:Transcript_39602/g.79974  ORF Transcript_39602/g.79974 Transcript_39602/m.79974 type:complete len:149 (+) Transcript_39602:11-457(+)
MSLTEAKPTKPRGRPPLGKVWDASAGWVDSGEDLHVRRPAKRPKVKSAEGNTGALQRPRGRAPRGVLWDDSIGWVEDPNAPPQDEKKRPQIQSKSKAKNAMKKLPAKRGRKKKEVLPPGWATAVDESTKRTYYFHEKDRVPQWHPPGF